MQDKQTFLGDIEIAPEAIETIAIVAANEIDGVTVVKTNLIGNVNSIFSNEQFSKGVHFVYGDDEKMEINVQVTIRQGESIPLIGLLLQQKIKDQILYMCDIVIDTVNIRVAGLN